MSVRRTAGTALATLALVAGGALVTAAPAGAATKCVGGLKIVQSWGKVTYGVCTVGITKKVEGTVTDTKEDGCLVKVTFNFDRPGEDFVKSYETGSSKSFESGLVTSSGVTAKLSKRC